jgi:hypothetical protein
VLSSSTPWHFFGIPAIAQIHHRWYLIIIPVAARHKKGRRNPPACAGFVPVLGEAATARDTHRLAAGIAVGGGLFLVALATVLDERIGREAVGLAPFGQRGTDIGEEGFFR